jgi:hypothetical protein
MRDDRGRMNAYDPREGEEAEMTTRRTAVEARGVDRSVRHRRIDIEEVGIFIARQVPKGRPCSLLPHGYPCSSFQFRMFSNSKRRLR